MLTDPVEDLGKAEFVAVHRAVDESVSVQAFDLDAKAIAPQEDIVGGERDALIAVEEAGRGVFVPVARDAEFMHRESLESRDYDRAEGRYRICRHVLQPKATAARGHDGTVAQRPRPPLHPSLRRAP